MDAIPVPKIVVGFNVELEVEYNSFAGKTPQELAESIQDEMNDLLMEVDRKVLAVTTSIKTIEVHD
jgi:hypothetical protein